MPSYSDGNLILPIAVILPLYAVYLLLAGIWYGISRSTGLDKMDYVPIPTDYLIWVVLAILASGILFYYVTYVMSKVEKDQKIADLKADAKIKGVAIDQAEWDKVENFSNIYLFAMLGSTALTCLIAYGALVSVIPENIALASILDYVITGAVGTVLVGVFLDFFVHKLADGTFKKQVYLPFQAKLLALVVGASAVSEDEKGETQVDTSAVLDTAINALAALKGKL